MKRKTVVSVIIAFLVICLGFYSIRAINHSLIGEPRIIKAVRSPDGEYTAYACLTNGGATTDFGVTITLLKSKEKLKWDTKANIKCLSYIHYRYELAEQ